MNNIGNKIRKIRELKSISPKDISDQLDITTQNYLKIERDEVKLSVDRLLQISEIFGMKPEEVLTFDEKFVFNNTDNKGGNNGVNFGTFNSFPEDMKKLYDENAKLQAEKIQLLEDKLKWLEEKVKWLENGK